jgi:hypothetical protein
VWQEIKARRTSSYRTRDEEIAALERMMGSGEPVLVPA